VEQASSLARQSYLAVGELTGTAAQGRILLAAPLTLAEIEQRFAVEIVDSDEISFDRAALALRARRRRSLHAITLSEQPKSVTPSAETARIFADALVDADLDRLPWSKALTQWRDRVAFLRKAEREEWPDLGNAALATRRDEWLVPLLADKTALSN